MNFKSKKDYQEHVAYCTDEMWLWLQNDEKMYNRFMRIMEKPWTVRSKAGSLRAYFGDFHNGVQQIGRFTRFTDIVKAEMENK